MLDSHAECAIRIGGLSLDGRPAADTIVLGVGNPLRGDDGIAQAVLDELRAGDRVPGGVVLVDGGNPGLETALILQQCKYAIIVDAADLGLMPGEFVRLEFSGEGHRPLGRDSFHAVHEAGLADALTLAATLGLLPERLAIFGVQPRALDWSPGLSPEVQAAVPMVAAAILDELLSYRGVDDGQNPDS